MKKIPKQTPVRGTTARGRSTRPAAVGGHSSETSRSAIKYVCVYCGSGKGLNKAYAAAARGLGRELAKAGVGLVYGGGSLGLMGEIARHTLKHGGRVTGIIPGFLSEKEKMLEEVDDLIVVDDMHQRKMMMFERADAFVALPGGIGTLEELVEQLTWSQLGRHHKPIVLANIDGFWSPFLTLLEHMGDEKFIRTGLVPSFHVVDDVKEVLPEIMRAREATTTDDVEDVVGRF